MLERGWLQDEEVMRSCKTYRSRSMKERRWGQSSLESFVVEEVSVQVVGYMSFGV